MPRAARDVLLGGLVALIACSAPRERPASDYVITHVNVIDVRDGSVHRDRTVAIRGNRILAVDSGGAGGGREVSGQGKYLIPGLWDMHVHINDGAEWFFPLALVNGVTGLRDMGGSLENLERWHAMRTAGTLMPRVIAAGPILTGAVDDADPRIIKVVEVSQASSVVDSLAAHHVDFIKVHDWLSAPAYFAIIARARLHHLQVAGHLPVAIDAAEAADSGQASIEHLGNGWASLLLECTATGPQVKRQLRALIGQRFTINDLPLAWGPVRLARYLDGYHPAQADSLARLLARDSIWQTPTLSSLALWLSVRDSSNVRDLRMRYLPAQEREAIGEFLNAYGQDRPSASSQAVSARYYELQTDLLRTLARAGVPILAGTDVADYPLLFPGFSLHDELARLVDAGLTPLAALQAATLGPSVYLHTSDSLGTVEPGKVADLVLLEGNPLDNIRNTSRVAAIIVNGRLIDRTERERMLAAVAQANDGVAQSGRSADSLGN